jgi:hypothetical protein
VSDFAAASVIMSETAWNDMSGEISAEPRGLELKRHAERVTAYVARVTPE